MKYLLDTNACIDYLNKEDSKIRFKIEKKLPEQILLCSVVKSELFFGAMKSKYIDKNLQKLDVFFSNLQSIASDDKAAQKFASIRSELEQKGTPIGPYDLQIASIAYVHNLILVTHNTKEFERVSGLKLEDWQN